MNQGISLKVASEASI